MESYGKSEMKPVNVKCLLHAFALVLCPISSAQADERARILRARLPFLSTVSQ